ncbi:hypothetical protein [Duganella sp. BuS-21]|uniref:hypothetical protein n=1 Tax=Duganella sp. BuS-21 TaxID=2943848 RepID=UPI0035A606DF
MQIYGARLGVLVFFSSLVWALRIYPMADTWLAPLLAGYAALLWWRPALWLLALPALLPMLDLAPRTGWFFLEEIDLLLMLTAGCAYWRWPRGVVALPAWPHLFIVGLLLLSIALAISLWRGLQPWTAIDANTFNNYLSAANSLRIAKGWLWTLVLLPPLRHAAGPQLEGVRRYLLPGMMLGLLLASAAAIRERLQFPGLLNFSSDYRITAPFSAMHTGGAALDGYLALSIPLLATWLLARNAPLRNLAALLLLPLAWYAAIATFSRALYLGLGVALVVILVAALAAQPGPAPCFHGAHVPLQKGGAVRWTSMLACALIALIGLNTAFRFGGYRAYLPAMLVIAVLLTALLRRGLVAILAAALLLGALVPIYHGYYVNLRFASLGPDWFKRMQHWRNALAIMDTDTATRLFGMGLGKFPLTYFWRNTQREQAPSYQFIDQDSNRHLRLIAGYYTAGYGELLRFQQAVAVRPYQRYLLGIDVWNNGPPAFLHINLCQRRLLYPQNCVATPLRQIAHAPSWQRYIHAIDSGPLGGDGLPVKLEFAAEGPQAVLDIDNISLRTVPDAHEVLRNGGFSDANNYWFFSSDRSHLPWHIKNLPLNIYFEMGWLGVAACALLLFSATGVLLRRGDAAWLAALAAFLVIGMFDSLLDVPRITILFTLLLCAAALQTKETA